MDAYGNLTEDERQSVLAGIDRCPNCMRDDRLMVHEKVIGEGPIYLHDVIALATCGYCGQNYQFKNIHRGQPLLTDWEPVDDFQFFGTKIRSAIRDFRIRRRKMA